jgi:lipopolysaccharide export system protein LptA
MTRPVVLRGRLVAALVAAVLAGASPAQAQQKAQQKPQETGVPNALQGFAKNKDQPVQIEAAALEVRDKDKMAVFLGNVVVTQGDTVMKCKELRVFYDQDDPKGSAKGGAAKGTMKAAQPGPGGRQSIRRLEALGGVTVVQKEQTARGDKGIFDMKSNTITLVGNVVVAQGPQVLAGDRLVVDLTTSFARVESDKGKPVRALISTGGKDDKPGGLLGPKETQKPSTKQKPTALPGPSVTN